MQNLRRSSCIPTYVGRKSEYSSSEVAKKEEEKDSKIEISRMSLSDIDIYFDCKEFLESIWTTKYSSINSDDAGGPEKLLIPTIKIENLDDKMTEV